MPSIAGVFRQVLLGCTLVFTACTRPAPTPEPRGPETATNVVQGNALARSAEGTCTIPRDGKDPHCDEPAQAGTPATETTILAGGCFWGMQDILRKVPGVISTDVGYAGGSPGADYEAVHGGRTGNAEAVRVVFNPKQLTFERLLEDSFFRMHDPTTRNRQGNDIGTQYRSAIFVSSDAQRNTAEMVKQRVEASGHWKAPIVTQIEKASTFTPAEGYHQDYLVKNPGGYTCHFLRNFGDDVH